MKYIRTTFSLLLIYSNVYANELIKNLDFTNKSATTSITTEKTNATKIDEKITEKSKPPVSEKKEKQRSKPKKTIELTRLKSEEFVNLNSFLNIRDTLNKAYDFYLLMEYKDAATYFNEVKRDLTNNLERMKIVSLRLGYSVPTNINNVEKVDNLFLKSHVLIKKSLDYYIAQDYFNTYLSLLELKELIDTSQKINQLLLNYVDEMPLVDLSGLRNTILKFKNQQYQDLYKENEIFENEKKYEKNREKYKTDEDLVKFTMSYLRLLLHKYSELNLKIVEMEQGFTADTPEEVKLWQKEIKSHADNFRSILRDYSLQMIPYEKQLRKEDVETKRR